MSVNVAVVGATGAVGDLMRQVLVERHFPVKSIKFLASEKSAGKTVEFAGKPYTVEPIRPEAFAGVQIVLSSTPAFGEQGVQPDRGEGRGDRRRQLLRVADGPGLPAGGAGGERRRSCTTSRRGSSPTRTASRSRCAWR